MSTIFHKIIEGEIPSEKIHEDDKCIAIRDISPVAPEHYLVIPKKTLPDLQSADSGDKELLGHLMVVASQLTKGRDFRLVVNSGEEVGQTVFQLHLHVLSGRDFSWPPG